MFNFFANKQPTLCSANPGQGHEIEVGLEENGRKMIETVNLISLLADVLTELQYQIKIEKSWIELKESGLLLTPQIFALAPSGDDYRTSSTIQVNHPKHIPGGIFEYQHDRGPSINESFWNGFQQWEETSLMPLLDSLRTQPEFCEGIETKRKRGGQSRRVTFGPAVRILFEEARISTVASQQDFAPPAAALHEHQHSRDLDCEHEFCDCCLFTNSIDSFEEILQSDQYCALYLYAARDHEGAPQVDCRLNGEDYAPGAHALTEYVRTWPGAGCEYRKQYVIVHNI